MTKEYDIVGHGMKRGQILELIEKSIPPHPENEYAYPVKIELEIFQRTAGAEGDDGGWIFKTIESSNSEKKCPVLGLGSDLLKYYKLLEEK